MEKLGKFFSKIDKCFYLFISIVVLDLITKYFVKLKNISTNTGIIDITYRTNTGSFFSLFAGSSYVNIIFIIASFVALIFLYLIWKSEKKNSFPLALIASGITGNLLNRIFYGFVIDWLNFNFWPVFNIADSAIVIGVIWLTITIIFFDKDIK